ncbi:MAG: hypothetical protein FWG26_10235 [Betaproteobacteria bacterium]|jgi:hypothetical protein|nr:hypothetical protein [Betaproteobacteria bacterium]
MSTLIYVRKNADGRIVALSRDPDGLTGPGWVSLPDDDPEVLEFIEELTGQNREDNILRDSDLSFVRVLEDVIDLLVERSIIRFTDLPLPAQTKLLQRRDRRKQQQGLKLLGDEDLI